MATSRHRPRMRVQIMTQPTPDSAEEKLAAARMEFAEVYRELYETAQAQRQLSGPRLLRRGEFEIAAEIFPVRHLSGDFFSVSDLGSTTLLGIADIAGKGLAAGMWFTHLLSLTRMYGESLSDPGEALAMLNQQMCLSTSRPPITTLWLARLDWATGELLYCNAGHPPPLLLRASKDIDFLDEGGPVLGALAVANYRSARVVLAPGDALIGYSDGLLECCNEQGEEFGVHRVIRLAQQASPEETATALLFSMIGAAQDFAGAQARTDDCSMLVVRREAVAS